MKEILTVSQLNDNIKLLLEETFDSLWVEGEVSNLRRPHSGHVYFTLKDNKSQIRAVFFRQFGWSGQKNSFDIEEGMSVLCRSRLSIYHPRGEYQLIIEAVEPRGIGALQKAFEQLKTKLSAEGLFDDKHKKNIPYLPGKIGIITSPTGAVIRDILNITRRRFPAVDILIAPVRVQGEEAASEITQALHNFQALGGIDVIIIARGGGSLEDLAPFNSEALAREIFRCPIPVISAIGHETDYTISDFVADLRAPTPSAAAELVVPDKNELSSKVSGYRQRLADACSRLLKKRLMFLTDLRRRLKDPRRLITDWRIHCDELRERLKGAWRREKQSLAGKLRQLELALHNQNPQRQIAAKRILLGNLKKDITIIHCRMMKARAERIQKNTAVLNSLSPLNVLGRGYSITRRPATGLIVRSAETLSENDDIHIQLAQGSILAKVKKTCSQ